MFQSYLHTQQTVHSWRRCSFTDTAPPPIHLRIKMRVMQHFTIRESWRSFWCDISVNNESVSVHQTVFEQLFPAFSRKCVDFQTRTNRNTCCPWYAAPLLSLAMAMVQLGSLVPASWNIGKSHAPKFCFFISLLAVTVSKPDVIDCY